MLGHATMAMTARWIGEAPDLPGVLAYGETEAEARTTTTALALPGVYRATPSVSGEGPVTNRSACHCCHSA
jgi:hypothetical protein